MRTAWALPVLLLIPAGDPVPEFAPPVRLEADGKPIDATGGHAAPALFDMDGDGVKDLLVGQFLREGKVPFPATMRHYRNAGTAKAPKFAGHVLLLGGDAEAGVPTG